MSEKRSSRRQFLKGAGLIAGSYGLYKGLEYAGHEVGHQLGKALWLDSQFINRYTFVYT